MCLSYPFPYQQQSNNMWLWRSGGQTHLSMLNLCVRTISPFWRNLCLRLQEPRSDLAIWRMFSSKAASESVTLRSPLRLPLKSPLKRHFVVKPQKDCIFRVHKTPQFHWRVHWDDLLKGHTCQHTLRSTIANEKHTKTDNLQSTAHRFIPSGPLPLQTRKMAKWCPWIATNAGNCQDDLCKEAGQNLNSALEPTTIS